MVESFIEKFTRLRDEKESILCAGLDPALPSERSSKTIPPSYLENASESEAKLNFCLDVIERVAESSVAVKINDQYVRGLSNWEHETLTSRAHEEGLLCIEDCKLGDIEETAQLGLLWMHKRGYDAVTFNPLPGNMNSVVKAAHSHKPPLGILVLTLMSNVEAVKLFKQTLFKGQSVYVAVADEVKASEADGCIVGATGHITEDDISTVRTRIGDEKLILFPGVGAQKGDPEKAIKAGGENILINVGRELIYSGDQKKAAETYRRMFSEIRKRYMRDFKQRQE